MSIRDAVQQTVHDRRLAGDARAGSYARERAWQLQLDFVQERRRLLVLTLLGLLLPAIVTPWFLPSFAGGLVVGADVGVTLALVWSLVVTSTGTAPVSMGRDAEQWTAQELRRLRRRGWHLVNHFTLGASGDVDHLLVGPAGIVVVETKWSASSWRQPEMTRRIREAQAQAGAQARLVGMWAPVKGSRLPVHTVVALWGGGARRLTMEDVEGLSGATTVLPGRALRAWIESLPRADAATSGAEVWQHVRRQVRSRDSWTASHRPPPATTPSQWGARAACAVVVAWATFMVVVGVGEAWALVPGAALSGAATVGSVLVVRRSRPRSVVRTVSVGAATGSASYLLLLLGVTLAHVVR